jgi:hypothetical protein
MATSVAQTMRPVGHFTTTSRQTRQIRAAAAAVPSSKARYGNVKAFSTGKIKSVRCQIDTRCRAAVRLILVARGPGTNSNRE